MYLRDSMKFISLDFIKSYLFGRNILAQPSGRPEISRISLSSFAACGGHELFIIGKNFTKGTEVIFQYTSGKEESVWSASAEVDEEFLQPVSNCVSYEVKLTS